MYKAYHDVLEPDTTGQLLMALNAFLPIRWLPIEANRRWLNANDSVHERIRQTVVRRIEEMERATKEGAKSKASNDTKRRKDLLTYTLEERYFVKPGDGWSVLDIQNQV
jgi:hypothetical protein